MTRPVRDASPPAIRWKAGEPPKDGKVYEMRRRVSVVVPFTIWLWRGWWDGHKWVRRNQFHGGTEALFLPTHWRPA